MGLGPPICKQCRRIMVLSSDNTLPYTCPVCNKIADNDIDFLWELPSKEQEKYF